MSRPLDPHIYIAVDALADVMSDLAPLHGVTIETPDSLVYEHEMRVREMVHGYLEEYVRDLSSDLASIAEEVADQIEYERSGVADRV